MIRAGQRLYDERKRRGLSLEAVSGATKIREEFLRAIEKVNIINCRLHLSTGLCKKLYSVS